MGIRHVNRTENHHLRLVRLQVLVPGQRKSPLKIGHFNLVRNVWLSMTTTRDTQLGAFVSMEIEGVREQSSCRWCPLGSIATEVQLAVVAHNLSDTNTAPFSRNVTMPILQHRHQTRPAGYALARLQSFMSPHHHHLLIHFQFTSARRTMNPTNDLASPNYSYAVVVPPSLRHLEGRFTNARNQQLFYYALFPADNRTLNGIVLFLHGLGDHCRRYVFLFERLCEAGFGVITYDMVNHGASHCESSRTRGHVSSFYLLVQDTNLFVTFAQKVILPRMQAPQCKSADITTSPPPLIISGTSFGALVGMHTVLSGCHDFQAAFWGGAFVGVEPSAAWMVQAALIQALSVLAPKVRCGAPLDYEMLWRDPAYFEDFKADALATTEDFTARTMHQTLSAMNKLAHNKRVEQPGSKFCALRMLFVSGSEDHVADQGVTRRFFDRLANVGKEFKVFDGVFHSVFEDPERDEVVAYVLRWLCR